MTGSSNSEETFITIAQAMRDVKVDAGPATGMRWSRNGLAGPDGQRIYLQTWAIGRQIMTTRESMRDFIEKVTAARVQKVQARSRRCDVSAEELKAAGLAEEASRRKKQRGG